MSGGPRTLRIAELDALRGLAALAVTLFHYGYKYDVLFKHTSPPPFHVWWGQCGVQLFFTISGFVILLTVERSRSVLDFAVSRFSRLYPAYWAALLYTLACVYLLGQPQMAVSPGAFAVNLTMLQMAFHVPNLDGAHWTLFVELCFYVAIAMAMRLRLLKAVQPIAILVAALSWAVLLGADGAGRELPYVVNLLLWNVPFFEIGIGLYCLFIRGNERWLSLANIAFGLVVASLIGGVLLLAVAAINIVLFVLVLTNRLKFLRLRPLLALGAISYTLYLIHETAGWAMILTLEQRGISPSVAIALTFAVTLIAAWALAHYVEQPALRAIRARYKRWKNSDAVAGGESR